MQRKESVAVVKRTHDVRSTPVAGKTRRLGLRANYRSRASAAHRRRARRPCGGVGLSGISQRRARLRAGSELVGSAAIFWYGSCRRCSEAQAFEPRLDLAKRVDLNLIGRHITKRSRVTQEPANGHRPERRFVRELLSDVLEAGDRYRVFKQ